MLADIDIDLEQSKHYYKMGERVKGTLKIQASKAFTAKKVGMDLLVQSGKTKKKVITVLELNDYEFRDGYKYRRFEFSFINDQFETFRRHSISFKAILKAYVEGKGLDYRGSCYAIKELHFKSQQPYAFQQSYEEILGGGRLLISVSIVFLISLALQFAVPVILYIGSGISALLLLLFIYLNSSVGFLRLNLLEDADGGFNVLAENAGLWKFVDSGSMRYEVTVNGTSAIYGADTARIHRSRRVHFKKETGFWANFKFPDSTITPASNYHSKKMGVLWILHIRLKTVLGFSLNYHLPMKVKRKLEDEH